MKQIQLKKLILSNWKSINTSVDFNDTTTKIKGRNGVGKTSLVNAWNWLLTSYTNANSPKNHELFDNRVELSPDTPPASVTAILTIDGIEYSIKKEAVAKFTRKKGSNEWEKASSDTYTTYLDDIEISATNLKEWIETNIAPIDMLVYCMAGEFFANLCEDDKTKARKVLEQLVGEIKQYDFKGDYTLIREDLIKYSVEQIEERTKREKKPIEERMSMIPELIKQKESLVDELNSKDFDAILVAIDEKKQEIEKIDHTILGKAEAIKPILGQRDMLFELINSKTLKVNERRNAYLKEYNALRSEIKSKIDSVLVYNKTVKENNDRKVKSFNNICNALASESETLKGMQERIEQLKAQRNEIKSRVFVDDKCSYCGQELPDILYEQAKEKFNARQEQELAFVVKQGKELRERINNTQELIDELEEMRDKGYVLEEYQKVELLEQQLKEHKASFVPYEETEEYKKMWQEIEDLKATMPSIPQNDNDELLQAKKQLLVELENLNREYGIKNTIVNLINEIEELKTERRNLANDIARLEGVINTCKAYQEERAKIISDRINSKLQYCQIQMWQTQKNGDRIPACIITSEDGIKYATLNNSNRIKTCVSLQELFCRHYEIELPIFIDECAIFDSFNLPQFKNKQAIYLFASDDNYLIIE